MSPDVRLGVSVPERQRQPRDQQRKSQKCIPPGALRSRQSLEQALDDDGFGEHQSRVRDVERNRLPRGYGSRRSSDLMPSAINTA